jgi:hypothetical protein
MTALRSSNSSCSVRTIRESALSQASILDVTKTRVHTPSERRNILWYIYRFRPYLSRQFARKRPDIRFGRDH